MTRFRALLTLWAAVLCFGVGLAPTAEAQSATKYTTAAVRLRSGPGTDARVVASIPRGAAVAVAGCARDWCRVRYRGARGYAAERYLADAPPARRAVRSGGSGGSGDGYVNSRGERVPSPRHSPNGPPAGASARCRDGTYSFSRSRRGTCSHHGGVARWL